SMAASQATHQGAGAARSTLGKFYSFKRWVKDKLKPFLLHTPHGAPSWFEASTGVANCAQALNIPTVEELPMLKAVYEKNPDDLRKYYQIEPDGTMGHKSSFGNQQVAKLVAAAIGKLDLPDQKSK